MEWKLTETHTHTHTHTHIYIALTIIVTHYRLFRLSEWSICFDAISWLRLFMKLIRLSVMCCHLSRLCKSSGFNFWVQHNPSSTPYIQLCISNKPPSMSGKLSCTRMTITTGNTHWQKGTHNTGFVVKALSSYKRCIPVSHIENIEWNNTNGFKWSRTSIHTGDSAAIWALFASSVPKSPVTQQ